jgi:hypothetical protein
MSFLFQGTVIQEAPESNWGPLELVVSGRWGTTQSRFGPVSLIAGHIHHSGGFLREVRFFVPCYSRKFSLRLMGEPANPSFVLVDGRGRVFREAQAL